MGVQYKYNPGFSSDAELIQSFVVRQTYLDLILETLRENTGASNQHVLVIGARGTGKTMLLRRVAAEVRANPQLHAQWYPVVFGEESYTISSAGEFWLEALFHIGEQTQNASHKEVFTELRAEKDVSRLRQRALAQLMDFANAQGKRILLIVENLNQIFAEQLGEHDDWELRHTLQNEPRLMLLGSATHRFEQIDSTSKAWFELLTIYELEPLSLEECRALWESLTDKPVRDQRLKPLLILTGGNPRLLRILMEFAVEVSLKDLMANLNRLIDENTDYFKGRLDNLPNTERKVMTALLDGWKPMVAREVAEAAGMSVSQASALLKRLVSRGAVAEKQGKGRKKLYEVAERLYNIYYLMRRRSQPASRVQAIVKMMVTFYQGDELVNVMAKLTNEACVLKPAERVAYFDTYQGILQETQQPELREKLLKATPQEFLSAPDAPESLQQFITSLTQPLQDEEESEWMRLAELFNLGQYADAIVFLEGLIQQFERQNNSVSLAAALFNKGMTLGQMGRSKEEIEVYDALLARFEGHTELQLLDPIVAALFNKATILGQMGRSKEEIEVYDALLARFEGHTEQPLLGKIATALVNKGVALGQIKHFEEEIEVYDALLARFEGHTELQLLNLIAKALFNKGVTLGQMGRSEKAIEVYDALLTRLEGHTELQLLNLIPNALFNKGMILRQMGRAEEALQAIHAAVEQILMLWNTPSVDKMLSARLLNLLLLIAAIGYASELSTLLSRSDLATELEAVIVGLSIFLGEEPLAPQEVLAVGQDIAQRIRDYQQT